MILTKNTGVEVGNKLSILDIVKLKGATVTPFLNAIGGGSVSNTLHSWISDTVDTASDNANIEVSGVGTTPTGSKQKTSNVTQILKNEVQVSYSQDAVTTIGSKKELAHQLEKGSKKHALDIERALFGLHNADKYDDYTERVGNTVAAKMAGVFNYVPTAHRELNGGSDTALDKSAFEAVLLPIWENNNDADMLTMYCSATLKSKINDFMKDYIVQNNGDNTIDWRATKIITDWGVVNVVPHRMFTTANGLDSTLLAFDPSAIAFKTLISTQIKDVPTADTAVVKRYYTEGTLEVADNFQLACADNFI